MQSFPMQNEFLLNATISNQYDEIGSFQSFGNLNKTLDYNYANSTADHLLSDYETNSHLALSTEWNQFDKAEDDFDFRMFGDFESNTLSSYVHPSSLNQSEDSLPTFHQAGAIDISQPISNAHVLTKRSQNSIHPSAPQPQRLQAIPNLKLQRQVPFTSMAMLKSNAISLNTTNQMEPNPHPISDEQKTPVQTGVDHPNNKRQKIEEQTLEQKVLASKERNRENARNTRLRKKAYIEKLKSTVDELLAEKEKNDREKRIDLQRNLEQKHVRIKVISDFLAYRGSGNLSYQNWNTILDEQFMCLLPITPYRSYIQCEVKDGIRQINGIDGMLADTQSIKLLLESIGKGTEKWNHRTEMNASERLKGRTVAVPSILKDSVIHNDSKIVAQWTYETSNAVSNGALSEAKIEGVIYAYFNSQNKLSKIELFFDSLRVVQNLQEISSTRSLGSIPSSIDKALNYSREAAIITESEYPYRIVHVNDRWTKLTGHTKEEAAGRPLNFLQGSGTEELEYENLARNIQFHRSSSAVMLSFRKNGTAFRNYLRMYPLSGQGRKVSHFIGFSEEIATNMTVLNKVVSSKSSLQPKTPFHTPETLSPSVNSIPL